MQKIISGGQTGADRAALDWAMERGLPHGGWCPGGRLAEDGIIPARYQLIELEGQGYLQRTRANVRDSDATLIISIAPALEGGSLQTARFARSLGKPWLHVHPTANWQADMARWIGSHEIGILNVAGPRASKESAVIRFTHQVLDEVIRSIKAV